MNKVIMMGRLTKDPETRYSNDLAIAGFSLAVDRKFKNEQEADFFNCTAFGKTAEFFEKYVKKGTKVVIEGRLQNDSYTNKEGQKVTSTKIIVEQAEFAESKKAGEENAQGGKGGSGNLPKSPEGFMEVPTDDLSGLPFGG